MRITLFKNTCWLASFLIISMFVAAKIGAEEIEEVTDGYFVECTDGSFSFRSWDKDYQVGQQAECKSQEQNEKKDEKSEDKEPPRRALPAPFPSPPFPSGEYQGYPLVGVPPSDTVYPLMKAIYKTPWGEAIKKSSVQSLWMGQWFRKPQQLQKFEFPRFLLDCPQSELN